MQIKDPVVVLEDDLDDQMILQGVFEDLCIKNELKFFETVPDALSYLETTTDQPFLILSDINLPGMDGLDFKKSVNKNEFLRKKSIPFVFYSTSARKESVVKAYDMMVQGFFEKPQSLIEIKTTIKLIMDYWKLCKHPKSFK
jgi:CheY-like chemotaxis protein